MITIAKTSCNGIKLVQIILTCTCWSSCSVILARSIETRSDTMDAKKDSNFEVLFHTSAYSCVTTGAKTGLKVSSWWLKVHFKTYTAVYSLFFVLTLVSPHTLIFFCYELFFFERGSDARLDRKSDREAGTKNVFPQPHPFVFWFVHVPRAGLTFCLACEYKTK